MTKSGSTVYTYAYTVGPGDGTATIAMHTGTDLAENVVISAPTSGETFTVDNTAPTVTVTSFPTVNNANKAAVTLSGACETASGTVSLAVTDAGPAHTVNASPACSAGAWTASSLNLTTLNDGTLTATVTQTDAAGNVGTGTLTASKDVVAPTVTVASFPTVNNANKAAVTLSGACETASGTVSLAVTDVGPAHTVNASPACSAGAWTASSLNLTTLNDGTLTATVTQTDAAGNVGTGTKTASKDVVAPTVTVASFPTVNNANKAAVTFSGACETASGTVSLAVTDVGSAHTVNASPACSAGAWTASSLNLTTLNDGTLTATVTQTDAAGNVGTGTLTASKDVVAPTAAITYSVAGPYKSGALVTITATFSEAMAIIPVPQISISGANYTGGNQYDQVWQHSLHLCLYRRSRRRHCDDSHAHRHGLGWKCRHFSADQRGDVHGR